MTDENEQTADAADKAAKALEKKKAQFRRVLARIAKERTTESGKACVKAAEKCVDLGMFVEARHWISLSFTADKAQADVALQKAIEKLDEKGAKEDRFSKARRGSQADE